METLRIVSWNIGQRGFQKTLDEVKGDMLSHVGGASILCLQETKLAGISKMTVEACVIPGYTSFFSFNRSGQPYSGVATFIKEGIPCKVVAEGLTGALARGADTSIFDCLSEAEYGGGLKLARAAKTGPADLQLDGEGRCLITDHDAFVLVNVYAPCGSDSEERQVFKRKYHEALRVAIVRLERTRRVIVVGDINISHRRIDVWWDPSSHEKETRRNFESDPHRRWMDTILSNAESPWLQMVESALRDPSSSAAAVAAAASPESSSRSSEASAAISSKSILLSAEIAAGDLCSASCSSFPTSYPPSPSSSSSSSSSTCRLVDVFRASHGDLVGCYTCWDTSTNSRDRNEGTRIDYTLVSSKIRQHCGGGEEGGGEGEGMHEDVTWECAGIEQSVKGSDHCIVWVNLNIPLVWNWRINEASRITSSSSSSSASASSASVSSVGSKNIPAHLLLLSANKILGLQGTLGFKPVSSTSSSSSSALMSSTLSSSSTSSSSSASSSSSVRSPKLVATSRSVQAQLPFRAVGVGGKRSLAESTSLVSGKGGGGGGRAADDDEEDVIFVDPDDEGTAAKRSNQSGSSTNSRSGSSGISGSEGGGAREASSSSSSSNAFSFLTGPPKAPLCHCGVKCTSFTSKKPGANFGTLYFRCPNRDDHTTPGVKSCGFFREAFAKNER